MKNIRIRHGLVVVAIYLLSFQSALARSPAPYMEGSLGLFNTRGDFSNVGHGSGSVNTGVFLYRLGKPFLDHYAVEIVLGTGLNQGSTPIGNLGINSVLGADFRASYPVGKGFEIFGRAGLARLSIDMTNLSYTDRNGDLQTNPREIYRRIGFTVGVGVVYDLGDYGNVFLEIQRFPSVEIVESIDVDTAGIAIGYTFFIKK